MRIRKILSLLIASVMLTVSLAACNNTNADTDADSDLSGTYNITMWVSEVDGVSALFQKQVAEFQKANPGIVINAQIEGVTEGDAASKVAADVATAPDIYCFAQDQLSRLVKAAALAAPGKGAQDAIRKENDSISISSASVGDTIYAYPLTSDNGYFMYYDKSIISESDADDMTKIIEACERSGKKFRFALENAWYTASFFFGAGCTSTWTTDNSGNITSVNDDFNSDKGLIAMKGMQELTKSKCYDSNADIFTGAGAVITGIWNANAAEAHFGKDLGAADLPSYTVDGRSYHLGSFSGNKLMGIKPQKDAKRAAVLAKLVQYLTGEECQKQRFEEFQWGPSNLKAKESEDVKANRSLAALSKQNEYAVSQGQIHGSWWDIARVLGADAKNARSDADLKKALVNYENAIKRIFATDKRS